MTTSGDKDDRFTKVVFGVLTTLLGAGVIGVWSMSISLARLDEKFASFSATFTEKLAEQVVRIQRLDDRVTTIERKK